MKTGPDPVVSTYARAFMEAWAPERPMWERDIADLRREAREIARACGGLAEPVDSVTTVDAGGVPALLYRPTGGEHAVLVWMHGGAWMFGDPTCYDTATRAIANRAHCAVLSVDYRMAPEYRYPAAANDCWTATLWASEQFEKIAVGGDSSGGNLAAAVALRARDRALPMALQVLVYPVLDSDITAPYRHDFVTQYKTFCGYPEFGTESEKNLEYIWAQYVPDLSQRTLPDASPMRATSLAGVAPAIMITAEHDILRAESEIYARRLSREGVSVYLRNYPGQIHGFYQLLGAIPEAGEAIEVSADALRRAFAGYS